MREIILTNFFKRHIPSLLTGESKDKSQIEWQVRLTSMLTRALDEYFSQIGALSATHLGNDSSNQPIGGVKDIEKHLLGVLKSFNFNSSLSKID